MVAWIGFAGLTAILIVQMRIDAAVWGTRLTPGVLLTAGYTAISGIYAVASLYFDFNPIQPATYVLLCCMGLLLPIVSVATCALVGWKRQEVDLPAYGTRGGLRSLLIFFLVIYGLVAYRIAAGSGGLWSGESGSYLSSGMMGHLGVVLAFLLVWYAVGTTDRKLTRYGLLSLGILVLSFNPVKGWTVIPLTAIALSEATRRGKGSAKPLVIGGLGGVLVFFLIYAARALAAGFSISLLIGATGEIFAHLLFYLTAGLFGLNAVVGGLELHGGAFTLFAPLVNIGSLLSGGDYIPIISDVFVVGLLGHGDGGNVFSMYGTLIGYAGMPIGILLALMIVSGTYILFALAWRSRISSARAASLYLTAVLGFGWFDYYHWSLTPYEVLLLSAVATLIDLVVRSEMHESGTSRARQLDPHPPLG